MAQPTSGKTPSMKVKKGDSVVVLSGKDKGAKGRVIAAFPKTQKVLVEGIGRVKKHTRISTSQRGAQSGGIVTQEAAIHVSNVMLLVDAPKDSGAKGKVTSRIGYRRDEVTKRRSDGSTYTAQRSTRIARKSGEEI